MRRRALSFCVRAFPRDWCERYGGELAALLEESARADRGVVREGLDLLRAGLAERARVGQARGLRRAAVALPAAVALAVVAPAALAPATSHPAARPGTVVAFVLQMTPGGDRPARVSAVRVPVTAVTTGGAALGAPRRRR